jgi:hypothetical protein
MQKMANRWKQPDYMPTLKEIEQKCEEIQRRWSERERRRRMLLVITDSECAVTTELDLEETEIHDRVPYYPDALTTGRQDRRRVPLSILGV